MEVLIPGLRKGSVVAPPSKSHAHRLLIANFLAEWGGSRGAQALPSSVGRVAPRPPSADSADILATRRCLRALAEPTDAPTLDCGESGSTLRFLAPIAAALGKRPQWIRRGRLAERPFRSYETLESGVHELAGHVSSQFVTGLLFALPLLKGDSQIRFTTPLESRGYVAMTLDVLRGAGIEVAVKGQGRERDGFDIPGGQRYRAQSAEVEGDWSGAAFWLAMNALGSEVKVTGLGENSAQPDRAIVDALHRLATNNQQPTTNNQLPTTNLTIDVSQFPDIFPVLTVVAAAQRATTTFTGIRRLRLKECDRVAAMADVLARFGVDADVSEEAFVVPGNGGAFSGGAFTAYGDHRIAMSVAVGATRADGPVSIDDISCAAKSYPSFFDEFTAMSCPEHLP